MNAVVELAKEINSAAKSEGAFCVEELEEDVVKKVAAQVRAHLSPMAAFFGGVLAQELVKPTGKFMPLKQWLHFDCFELLPDGEADRTLLGNRYDDYVAVFGREVVSKIHNAKTFMVGAGALGCEFLKGFALMGLGAGSNGKVICTDDDTIEPSNLNRQFLFRKKDVTCSKSEVACNVAKGMNKEFNV